LSGGWYLKLRTRVLARKMHLYTVALRRGIEFGTDTVAARAEELTDINIGSDCTTGLFVLLWEGTGHNLLDECFIVDQAISVFCSFHHLVYLICVESFTES